MRERDWANRHRRHIKEKGREMTEMRSDRITISKLTASLISLTSAALIALLVLLPTNVGATAAQGIDNRAVEAALGEDWEGTAELLYGVDINSSSPVERGVKGHACLVLNRNNESYCLFLSIADEPDLRAWVAWTEFIATKHPDSAIAHYFRGDGLARSGQLERAVDEFNIALEKHPNYFLILNARGSAHAALGNLDGALVDFDYASRLNPKFADAFACKGARCMQMSDGVKGALEAFNKAIDNSPDFGLARYGRAAIQFILGRYDDSSGELEKVLNLDDCVSALVRERIRPLMQSLYEQVAQSESEDTDAPGFSTWKQLRFDQYAAGIKAGDIKGWNSSASKMTKLLRDNPELMPQYHAFRNELDLTNPTLGKGLDNGLVQSRAWTRMFNSVDLNLGFGNKPRQLDDFNTYSKMLDRPGSSIGNSGGIETSPVSPAWLDGNWPFDPEYGLLYPMAAQAATADTKGGAK